MRKITYKNYEISYEITKYETLIHEINIDYNNLTKNVVIPDTFDNRPVLQMDLKCIKIDNSKKKKITHKIILPNTLKILYKNIDNVCEYINDEKMPRDLEYDYYGFFNCNHKISDTIKYSSSKFKINKNDIIKKAFYLNPIYQERYLGFLNSFDVDFSKCYMNNLKNYFEVGKIKIDNNFFEFYISDKVKKEVWISDVNTNNESSMLFIPNTINYKDDEYKVVGIGFHAIRNPFTRNIVLPKNIKYLSNAFVICSRVGPNLTIFLNDNIEYIPYVFSKIDFYIPYNTKTLTIKKWILNRYGIEFHFGNPDYMLNIIDEMEYDASNNSFNENIIPINEIGLNIPYDFDAFTISEHCDYKLHQESGNYFLLRNDAEKYPNSADILSFKSLDSDLIIPDSIEENNISYPIFHINSGCVRQNKSFDKVVIGKNIEIIPSNAIIINHCNDLIFKGRKIRKIRYSGLDINLETDEIILPNSIFSISENFISGNISKISFEKDSKLIEICSNAFKKIKRVYDLILPTSVSIIRSDALENVVNVLFEEGDLNLTECSTSCINFNSYKGGEYIGSLSNPYKVCLSCTGYKIHPDCEYVFHAPNIESINEYNYRRNILNSKELTMVKIPKLLTYYRSTLSNEELEFKDYTDLCDKTKDLNYDKRNLFEVINKLDNIFFEYKGCYYMRYKDNKYAVLITTSNNIKEVFIHPDCVCLFNCCFRNIVNIDNIVFEGNKVLYIGENLFYPFNYVKSFNIPDSVINMQISYNILNKHKNNIDDDLLKYYFDVHNYYESIFNNKSKNRYNQEDINNYFNKPDKEIIRGYANDNFSMEEYSILQVYKYMNKNNTNINNDEFKFRPIYYLNSNSDEFHCEFKYISIYRATIKKTTNGYTTTNNFKGNNNEPEMNMVYLYNHLINRKNRLDNYEDPDTVINLADFVGCNLIQYFLTSDEMIKEYIECKKEYDNNKYEYLGSFMNKYYVNVNDIEYCVEINKDNINILSNNILSNNKKLGILAMIYLKNNLDVFKLHKSYTRDSYNNQITYLYNSIINEQEFNKSLSKDYHDLLLILSKYDNDNNEYLKTSKHYKKSEYEELINLDKLSLRYYLISHDNFTFGLPFYNLHQPAYYEYYDITNQQIIDNLKYISISLLTEILIKRKFNDDELQQIIKHYQDNKEYRDIIKMIYEYQIFSEEFFINNNLLFINNSIDLDKNNNKWYIKKYRSKRLEMFLRLINK